MRPVCGRRFAINRSSHAAAPAPLRPDGPPEVVICVVDATNLRLNLRLVLELKRIGVPMVVALNMSDVARARGFRLDAAALEREVGVPVVETVAVAAGGARALVENLERRGLPDVPQEHPGYRDPTPEEVLETQRDARRILGTIGYREPARQRVLQRLDAIVMHPVLGLAVLAADMVFRGQLPATANEYADAALRAAFEKESGLDAGALRDNLRRWMDTALSGVLVLGSNGEAPLPASGGWHASLVIDNGDHSFSAARIELTKTVAGWLESRCR